MIFNTIDSVTIKELRSKYRDKLVFEDETADDKYRLDNLKPILEDVCLDDAFVLLRRNRLLVTSESYKEPTADTIVVVYYACNGSEIEKYYEDIQSANKNIRLYIPHLRCRTLNSVRVNDIEGRHNPLRLLNKSNTLTLSNINMDYLDRFDIKGSTENPTRSINGDTIIPLIADIKVSDVCDLFRGLRCIVRGKASGFLEDDDIVDLYAVVSDSSGRETYNELRKHKPNDYFYFLPASPAIQEHPVEKNSIEYEYDDDIKYLW